MHMSMTLEKELTARLRNLAGKRKVSALAGQAGLDQSIIAKVKDGSDPRLSSVSKLLEAMGARVVFPDQDFAEILSEMRKKNLTILPVRTAAGAGDAKEDEEQEPRFHIAVPQQYVRPQIDTLLIEGSSMEPTILDKAVVGVNREHREVVQGKIYAVRLPHEGIVIKRLYLDHNKKCFVLKSDNQKDAAEFPDVLLPFDDGDSFIYGRVSWVLQSYDR
jgi:phage repressor protein C with HTH and peptisase S24 domain